MAKSQLPKAIIITLLCSLSLLTLSGLAQIMFKNNIGGLNSKASPISIKDTEASDLMNVNLDTDGAIKKRNGYVRYSSTQLPSAIDGLKRFDLQNAVYLANFVNVISFATGIYSSNTFSPSVTITEVEYDASYDTITAGYPVDSVNIGGKLLYVGQGVPGIGQVYYGTSDSKFHTNTVDVGDMSLYGETYFKDIESFDSNIWYTSNIYGSLLYYSDTLDASGVEYIFIDEDAVGGTSEEFSERITGIKKYSDGLTIFKLNGIYSIKSTGDVDIPYIVRKSKSTIGCIARDSIQEVDNNLIFLSSEGVALFDGIQSYIISNNIKDILEGFTQSDLTNAKSTVYEKLNQYWLCITNSSTPNSDRVLIYDYNHGSWLQHSGIHVSVINSILNKDNAEYLLHGDFNGWLYINDYPVTYSDYPANTATAINAYYQTKDYDFDDMILEKIPKHLVLFYGNQNTSNTTLTMEYTYNLVTTTFRTETITLVPTSTEGKIFRTDLSGSGATCRFKFSNNVIGQPFTLYGWSIAFDNGDIYRNDV